MKTNSLLRTALLLTLPLSAACGVSEAEDPADFAGGKADYPDELCETAAIDDSGYCRATDGTFAPDVCCEANYPDELCETADVDAAGYCRAENGWFAPDSCCDYPAELCETAAIDDSGYCRATDGTFAPNSCCEATIDTFSCTFDTPVFGIDNSFALEDTVTSTSRVEEADYPGLTLLSQQQLFAAAVHLQFLDGTEPPATLFDHSVADENLYVVKDITVGEFEGDWIRFFAGDTEVGVVFAADTLTIVAEIGDGEIMACTAD